MLRDEDEGGGDAHEPPPQCVREPVALVQSYELGAVEGRSGCAREVMDAFQVVAVPGVILRRHHSGAKLGRLAHFHAVSHDDLLDVWADASQAVDALQHLLDETRRRVGPVGVVVLASSSSWVE